MAIGTLFFGGHCCVWRCMYKGSVNIILNNVFLLVNISLFFYYSILE